MPSLTFVLPHWLYWSGLLLLPLAAMYVVRRERARGVRPRVSALIAYLLLVTGGFVGIHRFYVRSALGLLYVPLFVAILFGNVETRAARDAVSSVRNELSSARFDIEHYEKLLARGRSGAEARLEDARRRLREAEAREGEVAADYAFWGRFSGAFALAIGLFLLWDALRLPRLVARCREAEPGVLPVGPVLEEPISGTEEDPTRRVRPDPFTRAVDALNGFVGEFVAWWSVIAVFVYYYEVIARYVFNSPTNWAHESMFLMFGMQYLLAGGYALREDAHVRVDVLYLHFSDRGKAAVDLFTSVFFFIFTLALLWSGWTFFMDSFSAREVSFTEWAIQYWPVKLAIPVGAALLLLQGVARLARDVLIVLGRAQPLPRTAAGRV